tara:strand:- start:204 stop:857 length:654 start_codon:yes stop_codon:yes gene_type:complete
MMKNEFYKRILSSIVLIPITLFFVIKGTHFFNFFLLICLFAAIYEWHLLTKDKFYKITGYLFILISFYFVYLLRNDFDGKYTIFLLILLICVSTDLGGYIFGKIFKGPKLTKVSPNKTYAGMIGGYLLSIIFTSVYLNYFEFFIIKKAEIFNFYDFIFVIIISSISQFGDITISYFKRKSKIKNTGKIIPGHGGILDRIDGMIFAFPSSYIILKFLY